MTDELKIDKCGHALWLTIDRPAQRNAMNSAVLQGIRAGLEQAHKDPEVRAVVLTGAGDRPSAPAPIWPRARARSSSTHRSRTSSLPTCCAMRRRRRCR